MSSAPTRPAAVSLLVRILENGQTLDEALGQDEIFSSLSGPDRGFARAIASATLRHLGQINALVAGYVTGRDFKELDPHIRHLLQIGAAQICILKTPLHAAVSETVDAARRFEGSRRAGGLVNAVLRKLTPDSLSGDEMTARSAWPVWFQKLMTASVGDDLSKALAVSMQTTPPLDLTVKADPAGWAEKLGGQVIGPSSVRLETGFADTLEGYEEGDWWVQDVAASLPVHFLAPKAGETILDLCAAPGGKTMQIAASGAKTIAVDRSAKRLRLVEQNLERTKLSASCIAADATKWSDPIKYHGVLVDAPCSALGTLRRHPEGPWVKRPDDLQRFPQIQSRLIANAAGRVRAGGRMVYCVCTPLPREGVDVVEAFLSENPGWTRDPIQAEEAGAFAPSLTKAGDLYTVPPVVSELGGCDAFFISRLVQRAD